MLLSVCFYLSASICPFHFVSFSASALLRFFFCLVWHATKSGVGVALVHGGVDTTGFNREFCAPKETCQEKLLTWLPQNDRQHKSFLFVS